MPATSPLAIAESVISEHQIGAPFMHRTAERHFGGQASAYAAQRLVVEYLENGVDRGVRGYKIGMTSAGMQQMCGIDTPIHGRILSHSVIRSGDSLSLEPFLGLECEFAVRLGQDLPPGAPLSIDAISAAVDAICPAFEIVNHRGADFARLSVEEMIADNVWNRGGVIGDFVPVPKDFAQRRCVLLRDGAEIASGTGEAVCGHPYNALLWLADALHKQGTALERGALILTGSLFPVIFVDSPARYEFVVPGIGAATVNIVGNPHLHVERS